MDILQIINYLTINNCIYNDEKLIESSSIQGKEKIDKLFIDYIELEKYCTSNKINISKLLYFNKSSIHSLLYKKNRIMKLNNNINEVNLPFLFYLSLIIRDNPYIINYSYSLGYIIRINELIKNENKIYKKLILSKIVIELIDNYKALNYNEDKIDNIEKDNIQLINDNMKE